jgi:hypothetical protein
MDANTKRRLEEKGWKVGSVKEFLNLTDEDVRAIEERRAEIEKKNRSQKKRRKNRRD